MPYLKLADSIEGICSLLFSLVISTARRNLFCHIELVEVWAPKTVGDTYFKFGKDKVRLVVKKEIKNGEETHWGLATNDKNLKMHEVIELYAQRGDCENVFSGLNQLHWSIMPKRDIRYNTVYLYVVALCYILFKGLAKFKSQAVTAFYAKMKFSTYIRELSVPCLWLKKRLKFLNKARDYLGLEEFFVFNTGSP